MFLMNTTTKALLPGSRRTIHNELNPMSEINLEKARVELQERKDRLKANEHQREMKKDRLNANEHEREMERKRLYNSKLCGLRRTPKQEHRKAVASQWGMNLQQGRNLFLNVMRVFLLHV